MQGKFRPVKASVIVTILLRIFAIHWAVTAIMSLLGFLGMGGYGYFSDGHTFYWIQILLIPGFYLLLAGLAWFFASLVARTVVPVSDPDLDIRGIAAKELYALGILVVGLIFFLKNLTPLLNWIHLMVLYRTGDRLMDGESGNTLYKLTEALVPCVIGAVFALKAPALADLLLRKNK